MNKFALLAGLAASSAAMADVVVSFPTFVVLGDGTNPAVVFNENVLAPGQTVTGFSFEGNYNEFNPDSGASWASDLRLVITAPNAAVDAIGGFSNVGSSNLGAWDFDGSGSTNDGFYADADLGNATNPNSNGAAASGLWSFSFRNDWVSSSAQDMEWSNVKVTIHTIPAPGAAALAGVMGLGAIRRRRA